MTPRSTGQEHTLILFSPEAPNQRYSTVALVNRTDVNDGVTLSLNKADTDQVERQEKDDLLIKEEPYGWMIVFSVFCIHIIVDGVTGAFGLLLSEFMESYGSTLA